MANWQQYYTKTIVPALKEKLGLKNNLQVPKIIKVTLNVGVGKSLKDPNFIATVEDSLTRMTGQKPIRTKARKSIAGFKIRQGLVIGLSVTLRKKRMYDFLEKLLTFAFPRVRDFRGIDEKTVDRQGNLSVGFRENLPFPEIKSDEIEHMHGLEVCITTNAKDRVRGLELFRIIGFPFKKF